MKHTATIVTIGDELLIGQTVDTNSVWMGEKLNALGIPILEKIAIADTHSGITRSMQRALGQSDIILFTGGLGPTKDDITKKVMAEYFGMDMKFDEPTWERIKALFARWGRATTDAHKEQCFMPEGAQILENRMGTAPGMLFEINGKILISMPGVPYEMKYIMENHVLPIIGTRFTSQAYVHHTILTAGEGESRIADKISEIVDRFPKHVSIAYLPNLGTVKLRLTARGNQGEDLLEEVQNLGKKIEVVLGDIVYGHSKETLSSVIGKMAIEKRLMIGTAESCTGGLVASKLVKNPGSSAYYRGSVVAYSYDLKEKLLNVQNETLLKHGAVSEETVSEMVNGACEILGVDVAVAISGIAGPGGGTEDKPVGTIWIAVGNSIKIETIKIIAAKNRDKNIEYASNYALNMMRKFIESI